MYIDNGVIHAIEQKLNATQQQVSVREVSYEVSNGKKQMTEWIEYEPNKTKLTHITSGYMLKVDSAPEEGITLGYQIINAEGDLVKEGTIAGMQPMYCGADSEGFYVRLAYPNAVENGVEMIFKIVRIPYDSIKPAQYLVEDIEAMR